MRIEKIETKIVNVSISVSALRKNGKSRIEMDFDILAANKDHVKYGATLVFANDAEALQREPGAAPTSERIAALKAAHYLGIKTWVSLEPVYHAKDALELIERTHEFVDEYKIGVLNYNKEISSKVNWQEFARHVEIKLKALGKQYYIKNDLRKYI